MPEAVNFSAEVIQTETGEMYCRFSFASKDGIATQLQMPGTAAERIGELMTKTGKQARLGLIVPNGEVTQ